MNISENKLWFPLAQPGKRPTAWWYYGRAIFVSRHDYKKIFYRFLMVAIPLGLGGLLLDNRILWALAFITGGLGLAMLLFSLIGLYLQYGHAAKRYFSKLLAMEQLPAAPTIADIHIGTYRHSFMFHELLPDAAIYSIDCKREPRFTEELAVREVQALETPPTDSHITTIYTEDFRIPLEDNSCDVVVFGFGTHEIPDQERETIFEDARRILKPGGKLLLFEHGIDTLNYFIFGPVIYHVTKAKDWKQLLNDKFANVKQDRLHAVNLFSATNNK